MLTEKISCLWVAGTQAACSNAPHWPSEEVPDRLCYFPMIHSVGTEEIDKPTTR